MGLTEHPRRQRGTLLISTLAIYVFQAPVVAAAPPGIKGYTRNQAAPNAAIIEKLFKDGYADPRPLSSFRRAEAINALVTEQARATRKHAVAVAYLLAVLRYKYRENRRRVLIAARTCIRKPGGPLCDEDIAGYACDLFDRGDLPLLDTILDIGPNSDGALAEAIGTELGDIFEKHTRLLLARLARRPVGQQHQLAFLGGSTDGSGMNHVQLRHVRARLRAIEHSRSRLRTTARLCLREIQRANAEWG